ncbi:MAG: NUDIX hydrolase [Candidatus Pacebacteria bacterium]|nr:NUDIX hydrolase [Candidatus Paceibacterota bacterium]
METSNTAQEELVDVIDEEGSILKVVTKSEAHQQGLLHTTVISEVIDSEGRWLLVKQSNDRQDAGQYVSPVGGHVSSGETEVDALKRESEEEIGLTGDFKYELVGKKVFNRHVLGRQENHLFAVYKIHSNLKPVLNHEADSWEYLTEEELKSKLKESPTSFGDPFHFIIRTFFSHLA